VITCAKCGKENQDHYKFCLGCGAELPREGGASKAFSPKTPPQGIKAAAAAPPPAAPPNFAPPPAAPNFAAPPAAPAFQAPAPPRPAAGAPAPAPMPQPPAPNFQPPPMAAPVVQQAPAPAPAAPPLTAVWSCPTCGHQNPASNKFCASCGTPAAKAASIPPAGGAPVAAAAAAVPAGAVMSRVSLTALRADGSDAGTYQLPEGTLVVGRDLGGIFGGDSYLSPKHATFKVAGGRVTVRDERSLNGVYIKLQRDAPTELRPGDVFRIGQEIIRFEKLQPPPPSPDGVERLGSPSDGIIGRLALVTGRETTGNAFTIPAHGIHMGRERGDILFPEDGYVSGLHCRVAPDAGRIFLTDLGSSNGTYLRFGDEREVKTGDVLLMGQQLFRVG
jgi:pSer/pThr/pTyr-binding forkhead associated (FHA) protein